MPTPGRQRLFNEGDKVQHADNRTGTVLNYEPSARKLFVEFDGPKGKGSKKVEEWVTTSKVTKLDSKGKPVAKTPAKSKTPSRSNSRGRSDAKKTPAAKTPKSKSKSPVKKSIANRTRSKSPARKKLVNADFSADDELVVPKSNKKKTSPKKKTESPKRKAQTKKVDAAFSADDEEELSETKMIEENSLENQVKKTAAKNKCALKGLCEMSKCFGNFTCEKIKLLISTLLFTIKTVLKNVPILLVLMSTMYMTLWTIDKKNLRNPFNSKLPALPMERFSWTWLSTDKNVWLGNFTSLFGILKMPVGMVFSMWAVSFVQNWFAGYNVIIGSKPRTKAKVTLKKVYFLCIFGTAFVLNCEHLFNAIKPYVPAQANIVIDPIAPYFNSFIAFKYDCLCLMYRQQAKFIFTLFGLSLFFTYLDFEFDFPNMNVQKWFINESPFENNVPLAIRFNVAFCSDLAIQIAILVLCSRNPDNYFLWIAFANQAVRMFISVMDEPNEEQTIRRYHQNSSVSGYWFYFYHITKFFVVLNFWRYTSKMDKIPMDKIRLALFSLCQVGSFYLGWQSNDHWPNFKNTGINEKIRHADRAATILFNLSFLAISDCKIGNQVHFVTWTCIIFEVLDMMINERAAADKAQTKYNTYFGKVRHRLIPKVF